MLHPHRGGCVPLAVITAGRWGEKAVKRSEAEGEADCLAGAVDVYVGQQSMRGWRGVRHVHALGAAYADLDTYRVERLRGLRPEAIAEEVLAHLARLGRPEPSLITFTGRGLAVVWTHDAVPAAALSRWQAMEDQLIRDLADFGADPAARDAARVLRLCGTVNSKSREVVRPLHIGARHRFGDLADAVLPHTRAQILSFRAEAAKRRAQRPQQQRKPVRAPREGRGPRPVLTRRTWADALLEDLHRLRRHRYGDAPVPVGGRDIWLWCASVAAAWLAPAEAVPAAVARLAGEVRWSADQAAAKMATVSRKAREAEAGQRESYGGRDYDPRYTPRARTVATKLGITPDEARAADLRLLAPDEVRQERERARWHTRREAAGRLDRATYDQATRDKAARAGAMRATGASWAAVAEAIGYPSADAARKADERLRVTSSGAAPRRAVGIDRAPLAAGPVPQAAGEEAHGSAGHRVRTVQIGGRLHAAGDGQCAESRPSPLPGVAEVPGDTSPLQAGQATSVPVDGGRPPCCGNTEAAEVRGSWRAAWRLAGELTAAADAMRRHGAVPVALPPVPAEVVGHVMVIDALEDARRAYRDARRRAENRAKRAEADRRADDRDRWHRKHVRDDRAWGERLDGMVERRDAALDWLRTGRDPAALERADLMFRSMFRAEYAARRRAREACLPQRDAEHRRQAPPAVVVPLLPRPRVEPSARPAAPSHVRDDAPHRAEPAVVVPIRLGIPAFLRPGGRRAYAPPEGARATAPLTRERQRRAYRSAMAQRRG